MVGADIFLLLKELPKISNMYRFSLSFYIEVFRRTLETKEGTDSIAAICDSLLKNVLQGVSSGMSNKDRLTLALHMIHGVSCH